MCNYQNHVRLSAAFSYSRVIIWLIIWFTCNYWAHPVIHVYSRVIIWLIIWLTCNYLTYPVVSCAIIRIIVWFDVKLSVAFSDSRVIIWLILWFACNYCADPVIHCEFTCNYLTHPVVSCAIIRIILWFHVKLAVSFSD